MISRKLLKLPPIHYHDGFATWISCHQMVTRQSGCRCRSGLLANQSMRGCRDAITLLFGYRLVSGIRFSAEMGLSVLLQTKILSDNYKRVSLIHAWRGAKMVGVYASDGQLALKSILRSGQNPESTGNKGLLKK